MSRVAGRGVIFAEETGFSSGIKQVMTSTRRCGLDRIKPVHERFDGHGKNIGGRISFSTRQRPTRLNQGGYDSRRRPSASSSS